MEFERGEVQWLRPEEYLKEIAFELEVSKRKKEKQTLIKKKRTMRKQSILALGGSTATIDEITSMSQAHGKKTVPDQNEDYLTKKDIASINKDDIQIDIHCITYDTRLENEEEVKRRKEEAEKLAALDKTSKKAKPPAKG